MQRRARLVGCARHFYACAPGWKFLEVLRKQQPAPARDGSRGPAILFGYVRVYKPCGTTGRSTDKKGRKQNIKNKAMCEKYFYLFS
jgi:hypothetical protein